MEWAYQHTAGDHELRSAKGQPYSMDPGDYEPMCSVCHTVFDRMPDLPKIMRVRHTWTRADGKRPIRWNGRPASTTDPKTWDSLASVSRKSAAGDGFGIMLGGGLGCYDLDRVTVAQVREFLATVPEPVVFIERSMSGAGVHLFIEAPEAPGSRRLIEGISVERYTRARFIRTTGRRLAL